MATGNSKIRWVRCPRCSKILPENDEVPLYLCGGCGITIIAKNLSSAAGNFHRGSSEVDHIYTSRKESIDLQKQMTDEEGDSLGTRIYSGKRLELIEAIQPDEHIPTTVEGYLDEEGESTRGLCIAGSGSIRIRNKAEIESVSDNSSLRSSTRSSRAYDGSISSSDDIQGSRPPKNYKLLSRRTFKNTKVTNTFSNKSNERDTKVNDHLHHIKDTGSSLMSSKEGLKGSSYNLESSFNSNEYRALRNWIDSTEGPSSSTTTNSAFEEDLFPSGYLGIDLLKLLEKVEELMHQICGLSVQRADSKRSYPPRESYRWLRKTVHRKHLKDSCLQCFSDHSCGSNSLFRANSYSKCCHHSPTHHKELEVENKNSKNKRLAAKRHCLPLTGGAPFIICSNCFKLLQLPADFLPRKKRLQKLQCGACSEVILYRPQDETNNRPSNVKDEANTLLDQSDPVSYSDDCGFSSSNSYPTDPDSVLHVPHKSRRVIEEPSAPALHQLFGYSSARELLHQPSDIDEVYESIWQDLQRSRQDGSYASYKSDEWSFKSSRHSSRGASSSNVI